MIFRGRMSAFQRIVQKMRVRLHPLTINATVTTTAIGYADALYGGVVVSNLGAAAAVTFTLPKAVPGMRVSAVVQVAQELRLDPDGTESVALPSTGVQSTGGSYITANAIGETVELICLHAGKWDCQTYLGTWTAV